MAVKQLFANNAVSLLASPITAASTSLTVMSGYGVLFPQPTSAGEYFLITLEDQSALHREIIKVTGRIGDTFTGLTRGLEGTAPRAWGASSGDDTLVDHRVTAETMRLAMELPVLSLSELTDVSNTAPTTGQVLKWNGTEWAPATDLTSSGSTPTNIDALTDVDTSSVPPTIGQTLVWNGSQWVPQTISSGSGTAWINGANVGPISIASGNTSVVNTVAYTATNRTFKYLVTISNINTNTAESFEVLAIVDGNIAASSEVVQYTRYGRVGFKHLGALSLSLDATANQLSLAWTNSELQTVQVSITRIQHQP